MSSRVKNAAVLSILLLWPCLSLCQQADDLSQQDTRLNQVYKQRVSQLQSDAAGLIALRASERDWIKQRDHQCGKDNSCLLAATRARAEYLEKLVAEDSSDTKAAPIPQEIQGKWIVSKDLKVKTISCWDEKQAQALIGTEIEYSADSLRWKTTKARSLGVTATTIKAQQFAEDHSGSGSSVGFPDLGITAPEVMQIEIKHADVTINDGSSGSSSELPGETVFLKSNNALVFSVCNVFFEARRE